VSVAITPLGLRMSASNVGRKIGTVRRQFLAILFPLDINMSWKQNQALKSQPITVCDSTYGCSAFAATGS
jgi:hypothetical protein